MGGQASARSMQGITPRRLAWTPRPGTTTVHSVADMEAHSRYQPVQV